MMRKFFFYAERLPETIANLASFEHWRKTIEREQPRLLFIPLERLKRHEAQAITGRNFPKYSLLMVWSCP